MNVPAQIVTTSDFSNFTIDSSKSDATFTIISSTLYISALATVQAWIELTTTSYLQIQCKTLNPSKFEQNISKFCQNSTAAYYGRMQFLDLNFILNLKIEFKTSTNHSQNSSMSCFSSTFE